MHLPFRTEKNLIGVCGASTCIFLKIYLLFFHFPHLHLCSSFDPSATQGAQRSLHLSLRRSGCVTVHGHAAKWLRAGSTGSFPQFAVAGELKEIEGSRCSWQQPRASAHRLYQEGLGDMKKSQYPLKKNRGTLINAVPFSINMQPLL